MTSHTISRNQFIAPREYIRAKFTIIPRIGTSGTHGVRKGRGICGLVRLITNTALQTMTNANRVPMLVMFPTTESGNSAENGATQTINSRFDRHGVWNRGCTSEKSLETGPSRDMEKKTRDCPNSITRITDVNPQMIPI